VSKYYRKY